MFIGSMHPFPPVGVNGYLLTKSVELIADPLPNLDPVFVGESDLS
jgi:hypothetical protein